MIYNKCFTDTNWRMYCAKCRHFTHYATTTYDVATDKMRRQCEACTYEWFEQPFDAGKGEKP